MIHPGNRITQARSAALAARAELVRRTSLARQPRPEGVRGPSLRLLLGELGALASAGRRVEPPAPAANPRPVMVLPGFGAHPVRMRRLLRALAAAGHDAHDWGLGFNFGPTPENFAFLLERVSWLSRFHDAPVALVGWSLGGLFARELAKQRPQNVALVVTMGTPFSGDRRANNAWRAYQLVTGHPVDEPPVPGDFAVKPPVPTVALWSPRDGVISPRSACGWPGERDKAVAMRCNHLGFASDPAVIAEVLRLLDEVNHFPPGLTSPLRQALYVKLTNEGLASQPAPERTSMAHSNHITLYDLQLESGCTISPFVWATKYALKHKGFEIDIVPNGFTGIAELTNGFSDRVPVIVDEGHWVKDSWVIAEYLDAIYPDRPMLCEGEGHKQMIKFLDGWMWANAIHPWFQCYILDYHDLSMPRDRAYVRESRERMFLGGRKLEEVQAGREERLPLVVPVLEPLRALLKDKPWLGGDHPDYGDYRVLACFLWLGSVAKIPALHDDDPLRDWLDRGFDLYGGLGRHPGMHTLFGLPKA